MYFEFESLPSVSAMPALTHHHSFATSNHNNHQNNDNHNFNSQPLLRSRHRRLSSSSQSLNELFSEENIIENITPSQCDLYLITRKKLSAITTSDLRREVLLASIHRNITGNNGSTKCVNFGDSLIQDTKDKSTHSSDQQMSSYQRNQFKSGLNSSTTSTSTTTIANTIGSTKLTSTNMTVTTHSSHKKRSSSSSSSTCSSPSSPPSSSNDYEEEWKTTIKRLKVVHGLDLNFDITMDAEFDEYLEPPHDSDLNDLTNNFLRLTTPFK